MGVQLGKLDQVVMVNLMEMGDQIEVKYHQENGQDHQMGLEKKMGVEKDQILVMMMEMEVDLPLPHQKTLHQQEEGTGGPNLSMYCRDLLGHQVKWDSQVRQVGMKEMAKHPTDKSFRRCPENSKDKLGYN